jgi:hypothetical protein
VAPLRFVACLVAVLAASGVLIGPVSANSCSVAIEWNGVRYEAGNLNRHVAFGPSVGEASVPTCDEAAGCRAKGSEKVQAFRLQGVNPHVVLGATTALGRDVFFAPGFFPQLPDHPLHEAVYGSASRPNELAGWRCGKAIPDLLGTVVGSPGWGAVFGVRFEGGRVRRQYDLTAVFVDARTTITGFNEFGLPRIMEGVSIRATVRECTASGGRYKVVPDEISNADS